MNIAHLAPGNPFLSGAPSQIVVPHQGLIERYRADDSARAAIERLARGGIDTDGAAELANILRGITSQTSALPIRENLDAEVHVLTPVTCPLRNRIPRVPGPGGLSAQWRQQSSFGTGLGTLTTCSGTTNSANTLVVANARGFFAGEQIIHNSVTHTIASINYSTNVITVGSSPGISQNTQTNGQTVVKANYFWPEQGTASRIFYEETGAPVENTTVYLNKTAAFKLIGDMGSVTMFAMATGQNFFNQYETEKRNTLIRAMLKEEYALLHADSSVTAAPWGDGTNALAFQGLVPFINANAPSAQIQTSVGALTFGHLQQQLTKLWYNGGRKLWIMVSGAQAEGLADLLANKGNYRISVTSDVNAKAGVRVTGLVHSVSGEEVPIFTHPFLPQGMIVFGADTNDLGQSAYEIEVLPQVQAPESAFMDGTFSGFYAQEIAPTSSSPEVLKFKVAAYEVPKWKNANVLGISTGVTAPSLS